MKSKLVTVARSPFRVRGFRRQTTALLAGLTLMAGTSFVLHAQLITNIQKSVLLSWPEPTEEQIVVAADSRTSSEWTPWHEPCFKHEGKVCMATPTTAAEKYFKLVPGTQFIDDFGPPPAPFTNRQDYFLRWAELGDDIRVTNGVLRVFCQGPVGGGVSVEPSEAGINLKDFFMSVDILDWRTSGTNWSTIELLARGVLLGPNSGNGYFGKLVVNEGGIPGAVALKIYDGSANVPGATFSHEPGTPYRLQFSGVGTSLHLRVLNLSTEEVLHEMNLTRSRFTEGITGIWINTPANVSESHEIILDNFFVAGTKP